MATRAPEPDKRGGHAEPAAAAGPGHERDLSGGDRLAAPIHGRNPTQAGQHETAIINPHATPVVRIPCSLRRLPRPSAEEACQLVPALDVELAVRAVEVAVDRLPSSRAAPSARCEAAPPEQRLSDVAAEQIARVFLDVAGRAPNQTFLQRTVNGQPGLVAPQDGVTVTVLAFDVARDRIRHIWAVRNPEKLRPWTTG